MNIIDFSRSLNHIGDDLIAEAESLRNIKKTKNPQTARHIAAAACAAVVILAAVFIGTSGERHTNRLPVTTDPTPTKNTVTPEDLPTPLPPSTVTEEPPVSSVTDVPPATDTIDTSEDMQTTDHSQSDDIPMGGVDTLFCRKFVDEVYNIYLPSKIVGYETSEEWVNNVFLKKSPEEMEATPTVYQIINELNITKEQFIAENEKYVDYPDMYYSKDVIDALYLEDTDEMIRRLKHPTALYYNGEIYTFDGLCQNPELAENLPAETMEEYLDFITEVVKKIGEIKYMQEDIDMVRSHIKQ